MGVISTLVNLFIKCFSLSRISRMEGFRIEIPLLKVKGEVISSFFDKNGPDVALCKTCGENILFNQTNLHDYVLQNHLKLHQNQWHLYLQNLSDLIIADIPRSSGIDVMKLLALIIDDNGEEYSLEFPLSRVARDFSKLTVTEVLEGFNGRIQNEYNSNCVGPYMGSYDQNESLHLNVQLSATNLDFEKYTEFIHSEKLSCQSFSIKDNYDNIDDVSKIDSLQIAEDSDLEDEDSEDDDDEEDDTVYYTCQNRKCKIHCPCAQCYAKEEQCNDHKIIHDDLFDEVHDTMAIRSTNQFCTDESFFEQCYLIKYAGIPQKCKQCKKDFLHHSCYHLKLHETCKFCKKNRFKTYAQTSLQLVQDISKHEKFLKTVCPHCDNKFCEPFFRKKHVEFEHENNAPFQCNFCETRFHSKQAKDYHESVHHNDSPREKCSTCGQEFSSKANLLNHAKYVHSDKKRYSCLISECEAKFKQKRDMRVHVLNIHGANISKAYYGNPEGHEEFKCDLCKSTFRYKKNLNAHVRLKHKGSNREASTIECNICGVSFTEEKNLRAHVKLKHTQEKKLFHCSVCGKQFDQKWNMKRHEETHNKKI